MRQFNYSTKKVEKQVVKFNGWIRGLNTLVSKTQIRPDELSDAYNIQLVEDGKIQCPRDGQAYFGASEGSRVTGLFPFYKSDGTRSLLRTSATTLQKYNAGNWNNVTGKTYTTGLNTNGVMAYDKLYLCNGTDNLTRYNGSTIDTFAAVGAPTIATVARTGGGAGTYTMSYKVTSVTATGESLPSAALSQTVNQATLDTTVYMTITWGVVAGATGYNLYGRSDNGWSFMTYMEGNGSVVYVDKGTITPQSTFAPPENDSTAGPIGKYISSFKDSLFIGGDPANPSRLYYSGGGDKLADFSISNGGGFIDISKNDGQIVTGMIVFKNSLLIFKEDSIYQFGFTTDGLPQVTQVSAAIGAIAPRSITAVENDVFFVSRRGVFTIGNEAGFAFDVLRTNELSAKVRSVFETFNDTYVQNVAAIYATGGNANLVIFSYTPNGGTTNAKALCYDRERMAWYPWDNINANCWLKWQDGTGEVRFLYGDDSSGYVKQILTGSDDFGTAIHGYFSLRSEDFGGKNPAAGLNTYKKIKDVDLVLRYPTGQIQVTLIKDGVETIFATAITGANRPAINWGHYTFADFLFADSQGTGAVESSDENLLRTIKAINQLGRSFMIKFDNAGTSARFTLLSVTMSVKPRSLSYRQAGDLVN
jgi:hypothetical protein